MTGIILLNILISLFASAYSEVSASLYTWTHLLTGRLDCYWRWGGIYVILCWKDRFNDKGPGLLCLPCAVQSYWDGPSCPIRVCPFSFFVLAQLISVSRPFIHDSYAKARNSLLVEMLVLSCYSSIGWSWTWFSLSRSLSLLYMRFPSWINLGWLAGYAQDWTKARQMIRWPAILS